VATELKANGQYDVHIIVKGAVISHEIKSAATGRTQNLGIFKDPDNAFTYGSIGFRTVAAERFLVDDLFVQPR
jgi:hypothetical protein